MALKDFLSVLFLDRQIEIKAAIAMFIPKHDQKRLLCERNMSFNQNGYRKGGFNKNTSFCWNR